MYSLLGCFSNHLRYLTSDDYSQGISCTARRNSGPDVYLINPKVSIIVINHMTVCNILTSWNNSDHKVYDDRSKVGVWHEY